MSAAKIADFLAEQRDASPEELQPLVLECEDLWERKLWHQLTNSLVQFFTHPASGPQRLAFYKSFILTFADKINQLKLVELALEAAAQCADDQERLAFLEAAAERVAKDNSQDALVYVTVAVARVRLNVGDLEGSKKDLDAAEARLDTFDSVETTVHAAFYDACANYYQRKADFTAYYRNALLYLACIDLASLSAEEQRTRAYHLALAALVSNTIYNFGELLLHPILDILAKSKEDAWLRDLLFAFNRGDVAAYDVFSNRISSHELLREHAVRLQQKIYLAALTEAVFRRPPHDRAMTFSDVAQETRIKPADIEYLIMKALSLGILRGAIDQVDEVAHFTWVQPKVLDLTQIANMRQRLLDWDSSVNQLGNWIETAGKDVWAA